MIKLKDEFIGRAKHDTHNHRYGRPWGYPIRFCDWTFPDSEIVSDNEKEITCKNCLRKKGGFYVSEVSR